MIDLSEKRVLLTGGAGFLGMAVQDELKRAGCEDIIVPRSKDYDLRKEADVVRLLQEHKPQIIIHLAAFVGGIGANREHPGRIYYDNIMMGTLLIEQARLHHIEKFVAIGTVCAYPKFTPVPFKEEDIWNGYPEETNAPYGLAKKMMLVQLQGYRQEYGFNGIFLIPVNLYGPGDNFDLRTSHVIPAIVRKLVEAKEKGSPSVELWGTGAASREFLYVKDAARAIAFATRSYEGAEPVNLGSGHEMTIRDLAHRIKSLVGYEGDLVFDPEKPDGQPRRCLDVSKAKRLFGFEATTAFEDGLKETIAWYRTHRERHA